MSGVLSDGFHSTGSPATSASAAFHDHTATGKLNAVITAHGPIGCHVSISRWPGRSLAIVRPCSWRDRPTAKSQMSIISWTSPRPSERILPASIDTSSPRSSLCSRSSSPRRRTRLPRTGAGVARHVGERLGRPLDGGVDVGRRRRPAPSEPPVIGVRPVELAGRRGGAARGEDRGDPRGEVGRSSAACSSAAPPRMPGRRRGSPRATSACSGGDDERWGQADAPLAARQHEQPALGSTPARGRRRCRGRGGRCRSSARGRAPARSAAGGCRLAQAGEQVGADGGGVGGQLASRRGRAWPARRRRRPGCRRTSSRDRPAPSP